MQVIRTRARQFHRRLPRVLLALLAAVALSAGGCRPFFGPEPEVTQTQTVSVVISLLDDEGSAQSAVEVVDGDADYDAVTDIGVIAGFGEFPEVDPPDDVAGAAFAYEVPRGETLTLSVRSAADTVFWQWSEEVGGNAVGKVLTIDTDITVGAVFRRDADILGQLNVDLLANIPRLETWANSSDTRNTLGSHPFSLLIRRVGGGTQYKGRFRAPDAGTADRLPGFEFEGWVINSPERAQAETTEGDENPLELALDRDTVLEAQYQALTHSFSTAVFPENGWGSLDVAATYAAPDFQTNDIPEFVPWDAANDAYLRSTQFTLTAQPEPGYRFGGFRIQESGTGGSSRSEDTSPLQFSLQADQTVTGLFERDYLVSRTEPESRDMGVPDAATEVVGAPEGSGDEFVYVLGEEARIFEISPNSSSEGYRGRVDLDVLFPSRDAVVYDPGGGAAPVLFSAHGDDGVRAVRLDGLDGTLLDWRGTEGSGRAVDLALGSGGSGDDFLLVADGGNDVRLYSLDSDTSAGGWEPSHSSTGGFTVDDITATEAAFSRVAANGTTVLVAEEGPLPAFGASDPFTGLADGRLHLLTYSGGSLTSDPDSPVTVSGPDLGVEFPGAPFTHSDEVLYRLQALELADGSTGYLGFIREGFSTDVDGNVTGREVGAALYKMDINNFSTTVGDFVTAEALDDGDPVLSVNSLAFDGNGTIYATTTAAGSGTQPTLRSLAGSDVGNGTGTADTVVDSSSLRNANGLVVVAALEGMTNGTVDAALVADGDNGLVRLDAENGGDPTRFAPTRFIRGAATGLIDSTRYVAIADDGEGIRMYSDDGAGSFSDVQTVSTQSVGLRGLSFGPNGDYLFSAEGRGLTLYNLADADPPIADTNGTGTYTNGAYTDGVYHAAVSPISPSGNVIVAAGSAGLRDLRGLSFADPTAPVTSEGELAASEATDMRGELLGAEELLTRRVAALQIDDGGGLEGEILLSADGEAGARSLLRENDGAVVKTTIYFARDDALDLLDADPRPAGRPTLRAPEAGALDPSADTVGLADGGVGEVRDVAAWTSTQEGEERVYAAFASIDQGLLIAELGTVANLLSASPPEPTAPVRLRAVPDARSVDFLDGMLVVAGGGGGTYLVDVTTTARPYVIRNYDQSAFQVDHSLVYGDPGSSNPAAAESARIVIAGSDADDYLEYLEVSTQ